MESICFEIIKFLMGNSMPKMVSFVATAFAKMSPKRHDELVVSVQSCTRLQIEISVFKTWLNGVAALSIR